MILINLEPESITTSVCSLVKPREDETLQSWLARKLYQEKLFAMREAKK